MKNVTEEHYIVDMSELLTYARYMLERYSDLNVDGQLSTCIGDINIVSLYENHLRNHFTPDTSRGEDLCDTMVLVRTKLIEMEIDILYRSIGNSASFVECTNTLGTYVAVYTRRRTR